MTGSRAVPALVAVLAVSALGVTATSLEASLTTDPDEEIDLDWDRLPIGESDAAEIKAEIADGDEDGSGDPESGGSGDGDSSASVAGDGDEVTRESRSGEGPAERSDAGGGPAERSRARDGGAGGLSSGSGSDSGTGGATPADRWWDLLATLLRVLLPIVALLALGGIAYRYRERLRSLLGLGPTEGSSAEGGSDTGSWPGTPPSNVVDRAWVTMVRRADPERPETATRAECETLARERGLDAEAVEAIATAFERVHYGGGSVAEEEDRARRGLRRLDGGSE